LTAVDIAVCFLVWRRIASSRRVGFRSDGLTSASEEVGGDGHRNNREPPDHQQSYSIRANLFVPLGVRLRGLRGSQELKATPAGGGIWFFSLDAASAPTVLGARLSYGLPYHWARMQIRSTGNRVLYTSARTGAMAAITIDVGRALAQPDALTLFVTERYRLYTELLGSLAMASVEHERWPLHAATLVSLEETVRRAARLPEDTMPTLVHYSPGVHVRVGAPRRLPNARASSP